MNRAFNLSLVGYFAALMLAVTNLLVKRPQRLGIAVGVMLAAGAAAQTAYLGLRWLAAERAPFSNMFESLVLFAWALVVIYLALRVKTKLPVLDAATALLALLTLAYASTYASTITPLMPALQSNWLTVHVFTCFLGYGGLAVAFLSSLCYLVAARDGHEERLEVLDALEATTEKTISFGFLFLSVGILSGAVWANSAWGTYWSWDPKETWSLITWFLYAIFLHCRFIRGWRGKRAAWISVIGFLSMAFTYFGVNFLLSGLHSYAK